ncbi:Cytochrome P450 94A1 [Triticum urartu]|uniref:Cytochrome P450 94A1 n=1 Tax=Triticum urartu TaxID=4572 RepID=M7Z2I6_TRIUA|nr:Cytochrome P450 94A1 [Triticum urartu]
MVPYMLCFQFVACCLLVLLYSLRSGSASSAGHGPRSYPVIGCLLAFYENRRRLLDWYTEMLAASPTQTIVVDRLGARRTVVTANPANVEYILLGNFGNFPKGKPFTDVLGDLLGNGIFNVDGDKWFAQRKLVSHEFSARTLRELEIAVLEAEALDRLVPAMEAAAEPGGGAVDMQDVLRRFAFDVICRVSLGVDPGCLDPALPAPRLATAFDAAAGIIARRGAAPLAAVWKIKRALNIGSERRLREEVKVIYEAVMDLIRSRKKERFLVNAGAERNDLLSRMIDCGYADEDIRDMVISFIMAGRDTTSSALTWFFWLLMRHRDVERDVLEEITSMRRDSSNGTYAGEGFDLDDFRRMRYGMGRMEAIWGSDAGEFSLERWLALPTDSNSASGGVSPFKYPVFQGGPRTCLGREMAFVQMKFVAGAILRRFDLRPVDEGRTPAFLPLLTSHMHGGLKVTVRRRKVETTGNGLQDAATAENRSSFFS